MSSLCMRNFSPMEATARSAFTGKRMAINGSLSRPSFQRLFLNCNQGKEQGASYVLAEARTDVILRDALRDAQSHLKATVQKSDQVVDCLAVLRSEDGAAIIAMEYAPFGDLHQFKNNLHSATDEEATLMLRVILHDMLKGVAHLHQAHLTHHDIKPSNFLIGHGGVIKLSDFGTVEEGLSRVGDPKVLNGAYRGPETFARPTMTKSEVSKGRAAVHVKAKEIYAGYILEPWVKKTGENRKTFFRRRRVVRGSSRQTSEKNCPDAAIFGNAG